MDLKADELLLNRYRIASKLGKGGFADVYKAFDTRMQRDVAIKQIHITRHTANRVLREARTVALLNHPNIVTIYEFERDGGECYLIMELIEGVPLSRILSKISPLSSQEAITIAVEICRALEAAHQNGIIHRDIKPENIMVLFDGRLKVMDFGIARLKGAITTTGDDIIGTFAYMSPEQARGEPVDERSDIFSLGTVLYEMITDCIPFSGESVVETLNAVQNVEPTPPSEINPTLNEELDSCVLRALEKVLYDRYPTAKAFREGLELLPASTEASEKVLADLAGRYANLEAGISIRKDANWRIRLWQFINMHRESITRVPTAIFLSYPFFPILRSWYGMPRSLSMLGAVIIYLAVLLRPQYGIGLAFLMLSLAMAKYSIGLAIIMLFLLVPYWAFIARRWPMLAVSPSGAAILSLLNVAYVFPVLAGLSTNPIAAAIAAGFGCFAFEIVNVFLEDSSAPELIKSYGLWSLIEGEVNPIYILQMASGPFLENKILVIQPALWALAAALVSIIKGLRRWLPASLTGFIVIVIGYQGIFTSLGGDATKMAGLMQRLSFSLIILLLLPIFRPPIKNVEEFESVDEFTK